MTSRTWKGSSVRSASRLTSTSVACHVEPRTSGAVISNATIDYCKTRCILPPRPPSPPYTEYWWWIRGNGKMYHRWKSQAISPWLFTLQMRFYGLNGRNEIDRVSIEFAIRWIGFYRFPSRHSAMEKTPQMSPHCAIGILIMTIQWSVLSFLSSYTTHVHNWRTLTHITGQKWVFTWPVIDIAKTIFWWRFTRVNVTDFDVIYFIL